MTATPAPVVTGWLRTHRRAHRGPSPGDLLYRLYLLAFFGTPVVWFFNQSITLDAFVLAPGPRTAVVGWLPAVLPAVLLVVLQAGLRFGTWQGPVVLSHADVRWLLTAPVDRRALLAGPLARGIAVGMMLGAAGGLLVATTAAVLLGVGFVRLLVVAGVSWAAMGAITAALTWFVESSRRRARVVVRSTPLVVAVAVLLAALSRGTAHPWSPWWWGPPGWASLPVLDAVGVPAAAPAPALAVLCATAIVLAVAAVRRADAAPFEQLETRATFGAGFRASIYFLDLRAAGLARRAAHHAICGRRARRLPPPPWPALATAWADVLQVLRARRVVRLVTGVVAFAAAAAAGAGRDAAITTVAAHGAVLGGYVAASAVIEPVWSELEQRFGRQYLPAEPWVLIRGHLGVAALQLAVVLAPALAVASPSASMPLMLAAVVLTCPLLALAAAVPPTGPPPDVSLLLFGESGIALVIGQLLRGPVTALLLAAGPLALLMQQPTVSRLAIGALWCATAGGAAAVWVRRRVRNVV